MRGVEKTESISAACGLSPGMVSAAVANRFIADHPPTDYGFRAFYTKGFRQMADGRWNLDLQGAVSVNYGENVWVCAQALCDRDRSMDLAVNCFGPVRVWLNGEQVWRSSAREEVDGRIPRIFDVNLKKGQNLFQIQVQRCKSGFGCIFGSARNLINPLIFTYPHGPNAGSIGWQYSADGQHWQPELRPVQPDELYPSGAGYVYGYSKRLPGEGGYLKGEAQGRTALYLQGKEVAVCDGGDFSFFVGPSQSEEELILECQGTVRLLEQTLPLRAPCQLQGSQSCWIFVGRVERQKVDEAAQLSRVFQSVDGDEVYWRLPLEDTVIRPTCEYRLFGDWIYSLGVTMYGLIQAARTLKRQDIFAYVKAYFDLVTSYYRYSKYDRKLYGYPFILQRLSNMEMLDDGGSMGSALLELKKEVQNPDYDTVIEDIASYIMNKQERTAEGGFYRHRPGTYYEDTLWADDLYMSVPFLTRYYASTSNPEALDLAAKQFSIFKGYLYIEEKQLMAHVYDFKTGVNTGIFWGRGNGWVLFSLAEILGVMPKEHPKREALLEFYRTLCGSIVRFQSESGLWRQIITNPEAYRETSCTGMFTYALAMGVKNGWLDESYQTYIDKAWKGLCDYSVDYKGNVYGVCWGSAFSYSEDYYKNDLLTALNDTHGTGILLIAAHAVSKQ